MIHYVHTKFRPILGGMTLKPVDINGIISSLIWPWLIPVQLKPSPKYGPKHSHSKLSERRPSLIQVALTSQGSAKQGSGTVVRNYCNN